MFLSITCRKSLRAMSDAPGPMHQSSPPHRYPAPQRPASSGLLPVVFWRVVTYVDWIVGLLHLQSPIISASFMTLGFSAYWIQLEHMTLPACVRNPSAWCFWALLTSSSAWEAKRRPGTSDKPKNQWEGAQRCCPKECNHCHQDPGRALCWTGPAAAISTSISGWGVLRWMDQPVEVVFSSSTGVMF